MRELRAEPKTRFREQESIDPRFLSPRPPRRLRAPMPADSAGLAAPVASTSSPGLGTGAPPPPAPPATTPATAEVDRILANPHNAYHVLGLARDAADADAVKAAYRRLSRVVHPDKSHHPRATEAAAALNRAHEALTSSGWARRAYNAYMDDVENGRAGGAPPSFEEWQAQGVARNLPTWAKRLLACPGGPCVLCVLAVIALPILLVAAVLATIICFPIQAALSICGVVPPPGAGCRPPRARRRQRRRRWRVRCDGDGG